MNKILNQTKQPISKSTKVYTLLCMGGILFPPLFLVGGVGLLIKGIKLSFTKIKELWKNREAKEIDCFSDNFKLSRKGVINKDSKDFLRNTLTKHQIENDKMVFDMKSGFSKNDLFLYSFDKGKSEFIKERVVGKENGKWIIEKLEISKSEINKLNYLYEDKVIKIKDQINKEKELAISKIDENMNSDTKLLEYCKPDSTFKTCSEINSLQKSEILQNNEKSQKC